MDNFEAYDNISFQKGEAKIMAKAITLAFQLAGAIRFDKEIAVHVSYCPALDIFSQGNTQDEAKQALQSAVQMFVMRCYEKGTLLTVLKDRGFAASQPILSPQDAAGEFIFLGKQHYEGVFELNVPIPLIAEIKAGRVS
ncbi:MAG TPA: hypothetical protein VGL91_09005 [Acidobacteriota bacterium]|jgi:predicted RNase H-like HicB family nuclease